MDNPYLEREVTVSNFSEITKRIISCCRYNAAGLGLRALRIFLRKIDKKNDGLLEPTDLKYGLRAFGVEISVDEMNALMKYFDHTKCGRISLNEMLHAMRSNSMNEAREKVVS